MVRTYTTAMRGQEDWNRKKTLARVQSFYKDGPKEPGKLGVARLACKLEVGRYTSCVACFEACFSICFPDFLMPFLFLLEKKIECVVLGLRWNWLHSLPTWLKVDERLSFFSEN